MLNYLPTVFEVENSIWKWFSSGSEFSEKYFYNISNWPQHQRRHITHKREQQKIIKDGWVVRHWHHHYHYRITGPFGAQLQHVLRDTTPKRYQTYLVSIIKILENSSHPLVDRNSQNINNILENPDCPAVGEERNNGIFIDYYSAIKRNELI